MITLAVLCLVAVVLIAVVLAILSIPFTIIGAILPWLLGVAGVVLLVKALLDKPLRWENFTPAAAAFIASALLRWIF